MRTQICVYCGKAFQCYSAHKRKYCSGECSQRGQGLKGKRWTEEEDNFIRKNYLSMTRAGIGKAINRTENAIALRMHYTLHLRKEGLSQVVSCDYCGKEFKRYASFIKAHSHIWGQFCNRECRGKWVSEHIIGERHPHWRGGTILYNGYWRQARRQARKRSNGLCEACGKTTVENRRQLDTHHIIPVRAFLISDVAHTLKNVVCLCRQCHIKAHHPS